MLPGIDDDFGELCVESEQQLGTEVTVRTIAAGQTIPHKFTFDTVFGPQISQYAVYESCGKPVVDAFMSGNRACLFCYGQTGSGKTFSLLGAEGGRSVLDGVVPKIADEIFCRTSAMESARVSAAYYEIYDDRAYDLLRDPEEEPTPLPVRCTGEGFEVMGNVSERVRSGPELMELIVRATELRTTSYNNFHEDSSRSHAFLCLTVDRDVKRTLSSSASSGDLAQSEMSRGSRASFSGAPTLSRRSSSLEGKGMAEASWTQARLLLVDLAGSETYDVKEPHAKINVGLLALGGVLSALAKQRMHVPFRNSTLTKLLQSSLSGDGRTVMLANLNPASAQAFDTLSTLSYARSAQGVTRGGRLKHSAAQRKGHDRPNGAAGDGEDGEGGELEEMLEFEDNLDDDLELNRRVEVIETHRYGKLYARCVGEPSDPLVLYLHGAGADSSMWNAMVLEMVARKSESTQRLKAAEQRRTELKERAEAEEKQRALEAAYAERGLTDKVVGKDYDGGDASDAEAAAAAAAAANGRPTGSAEMMRGTPRKAGRIRGNEMRANQSPRRAPGTPNRTPNQSPRRVPGTPNGGSPSKPGTPNGSPGSLRRASPPPTRRGSAASDGSPTSPARSSSPTSSPGRTRGSPPKGRSPGMRGPGNRAPSPGGRPAAGNATKRRGSGGSPRRRGSGGSPRKARRSTANEGGAKGRINELAKEQLAQEEAQREKERTQSGVTFQELTQKLSAALQRRRNEMAQLACDLCGGLLLQPAWLPCAHVLCGVCVAGTVRYFDDCPTCLRPLGGRGVSMDVEHDAVVRRRIERAAGGKSALCKQLMASQVSRLDASRREEDGNPRFVLEFGYEAKAMPQRTSTGDERTSGIGRTLSSGKRLSLERSGSSRGSQGELARRSSVGPGNGIHLQRRRSTTSLTMRAPEVQCFVRQARGLTARVRRDGDEIDPSQIIERIDIKESIVQPTATSAVDAKSGGSGGGGGKGAPVVADNVKAAFKMFDTDGSGDIDVGELTMALKQLGLDADPELVSKATADKAGLTLVEFNALVNVLIEANVKRSSSPPRQCVATIVFDPRLGLAPLELRFATAGGPRARRLVLQLPQGAETTCPPTAKPMVFEANIAGAPGAMTSGWLISDKGGSTREFHGRRSFGRSSSAAELAECFRLCASEGPDGAVGAVVDTVLQLLPPALGGTPLEKALADLGEKVSMLTRCVGNHVELSALYEQLAAVGAAQEGASAAAAQSGPLEPEGLFHVALDCPAHGLSDDRSQVPGRQHLSALVLDPLHLIATCIKALGKTHAYCLVGSGQGGGALMRALQQQPMLANFLVVTSPQIDGPTAPYATILQPTLVVSARSEGPTGLKTAKTLRSSLPRALLAEPAEGETWKMTATRALRLFEQYGWRAHMPNLGTAKHLPRITRLYGGLNAWRVNGDDMAEKPAEAAPRRSITESPRRAERRPRRASFEERQARGGGGGGDASGADGGGGGRRGSTTKVRVS